jgi:alpha-1,3-rhamnosyl/mannosyltransferase
MKLIINKQALNPPLSGIGRYSLGLLNSLIKLQTIEEIVAFSPFRHYSFNELKTIMQQLSTDESTDAPLQPGKELFKRMIKALPFTRSSVHTLQNYYFRTYAKNYDNSIYWESNYILNDFDGLKVTTVHDLSHYRYPEYHPLDRQRWLNTYLGNSLEAADAIVTVSSFSKQEIIDIYQTDPDKIFIIPPALSQDFLVPPNPQQLMTVKEHYQLPEQFILSVGNLEPRKNLPGLIRAYQQLPKQQQQRFPLIIAGNKAWLSDDIKTLIEKMERQGLLRWIGYVAQKDLPALYSLAALFVYISFYEGFGMPIREALACNTPVITSNVSAMPEAAAGCAVLVDPQNETALVDNLRRKLDNLLSSKENITPQPPLLSWDDSAQQLLQVFEIIS